MSDTASQVLALHFTRAGGDRLRDMVVGAPMARLLGLEASAEEFERKAIQLQPDVLLVEYLAEDQNLTDLLERLRRSVPRGAVVVLANSREPEEILKAMRLGVREYLLEDGQATDFNDAVLRMMRQGSGAGAPRAKMVAVMGVKGGVGGSHLVVNLAWALSQSLGQRVALTDLDLSGGDLALLLDVEPMRDFTNVASEFNRLDAVLMDSLLTEVAPGLRLLAAPVDPVAAEGVTAQHVGRALDHLADAHQIVLMDLSSHLGEVSLLAQDRADLILLVVEPTVVGLKSARRLLHLSERLGHAPSKWALVVNRDGAKGCVPRAEVQRALGKPALAFLPNDSQIIMESSNAGRAVLRDWPRAKWSKEVMGLAKHLLGGEGGKQ